MNAAVHRSYGEAAPSNGGIAEPMVPDRATRTLRTIFAADVVGYSRHMAEAETDTVASLVCHRDDVDGVIARWGGRIFTTAIDSVVPDFGSPGDAVRCAIDVPEAIRALHERAVVARQLAFRIGVHTGDVMRRGDSILGDAVNVAARLESLARPGGLLISREVRAFLDPDLARAFVPRGREMLGEVGRTIEAYEPPYGPTPRWVKLRRELMRGRWIVAVVVGFAAFSYAFAVYDGIAFLSVGIGYRMAPTERYSRRIPARLAHARSARHGRRRLLSGRTDQGGVGRQHDTRPVPGPNLHAAPVSVPTDDTRAHHEGAGSAPVRRTLRTILGVEAVDYAGHVNAAEEDTVAALGRYRAVIDALIAARGGRIFTTTPQSVLAEFESPVEAVRCALDIQEGVAGPQRDRRDLRPLQFRVGVHTSDVLRTGDNLLGDAVNVAARLEGIADPGSIYISQEVKSLLEAKLTVQFRFQGNKLLKNIPRPVATYEISAVPIAAWRLVCKRSRRARRIIILGSGLAALTCGLIYLAYDSAQRLRTGVAVQSTMNILDRDPAPGTLAYGKTVLVDDGSCSGGQAKELTGGNNNRNIPRSSRCVDRP